MEHFSENLPWRAGRWFGPPPDAVVGGASKSRGFTLGARPGEFFPEVGSDWALQFQCLEKAGCLAHGCVLAAGRGLHHVFCAAPGILCGVAEHPVEVELESQRFAVRRDGGESVIRGGGLCVALRVEEVAGGTRWALVCSRGNEHEALVHARAALAFDARGAWENLCARRAVVQARLACEARLRSALADSVELLLGAVRPAEGTLPGLWLNTEGAEAAMDFSRAVSLLPALAVIAPEDALEILRTMLVLQEPDGSLPVRVEPDGEPRRATLPRPFFAQASLAVWRMNPSLEIPPRLLERLIPLTGVLLERFAPRSSPAPRWRSAEEAVVPQIYDAELFSPEVAALLIAEVGALEELAAPFPDFAPGLAPLLARRDELRAVLMNFFWSAEQRRFQSRFVDGRAISRVTVASVLPLLSGSLTDAQRAAVVELLEKDGALRTAAGVASWARWDGDDAEPPVEPGIQSLVLRGLRACGCGKLAGELGREVGESFGTGRGGEGVASLEAAALVVEIAADGRFEGGGARAGGNFSGWLDRHRGGLVAAVVLVALSFALVLAWPQFFPKPDESAFESELRLARMRVAEGNFSEAVSHYRALLDSPLRDAEQVDFQFGNAWARQGAWAQAEAAYREALARNPDQPRAWVNLAIARFELGNLDGAEQTCGDFLAKYRVLYPDLAAKVEVIRSLIVERRAVKRVP